MTPSPSPLRHAGHMESRSPRTGQTPGVKTLDQPSDPTNALGRRIQLQLSECVETKTVTTTTRLTRKFPHIFVSDPLKNLDAAEYPLASQPTPPEFMHVRLDLSFGAQPRQRFSHGDGPAPDIDASSRWFESETNDDSAAMPASTDAPDDDSARSCTNTRRRRNRRKRILAVNSAADTAPKSVSSQLKTARGIDSQAISDKIRRSMIQGSSANADMSLGKDGSSTSGNLREAKGNSSCLEPPDATPMTEASSWLSGRRSVPLDRMGNSPPGPRNSQASCDVASPAGSDSHTIFSEVATPPVTDADAEDSLPHAIHALHRPAIDVVAAQDASLPSPRLSPTLGASQIVSTDNDDQASRSVDALAVDHQNSPWADESQAEPLKECQDLISNLVDSDGTGTLIRHSDAHDESPPVLMDTQMMLEAFDLMRPEMKTFMVYQFLRRCPRSTLRLVLGVIKPALKCDFLDRLPLEMSYHVLSYLECRDLCRAAQVSKRWRTIINCNEKGWKDLLDYDGFVVPPSELQQAISQGWGWQDPEGLTGCERDLSMKSRLTSSAAELMSNYRRGNTKMRSSKRKCGFNSYASERSKRRATHVDSAGANDSTAQQTVLMNQRSEGPLSAASAAAAAIANPQLGLPGLRQLHLFKSLYRRHYLIRKGWMNGKLKPSHVAFAAHPRHVITCLQFDDDKIITGSDDTLIHIYDTKTGKLRRRLEGHEGGVWALQYEGNILVSGSTDRSVRVWDIQRGLCQQVFYGHTSTVRCLQVLMPSVTGQDSMGRSMMQPEHPLIITGSRDSQLRIWRLPEVGSRRYIQTHPPAQETDCPYFIRTLSGHTNSVRAIAAHGDTLVSGSYDSTVRVWSISTGECVHVLRGHTSKVYSVVLDPKRQRCVSGSMDSTVRVWDLKKGKCTHLLEGHSLLVGLLDLRDDRLISAAADATLRVWDLESGRCKHTLVAHSGAITCFQHDGRKVISGSEQSIKIWDAQSGEYITTLLAHLNGVWQVKFDDRRLVAAVQRDQLTYIEILDYGAARDGVPPQDLGKRKLLNPNEVRELLDEGTD